MAGRSARTWMVKAFWLRPLDPDTAHPVMRALAFSLTFAVVVATFASSRIEVLRQQVAEARKLGLIAPGEQPYVVDDVR